MMFKFIHQYLKGLAQAKIIKKSVILFWLALPCKSEIEAYICTCIMCIDYLNIVVLYKSEETFKIHVQC